MKWQEWLDKWSMTGLSINAGFLSLDFAPNDPDRDAAWELYMELLTRIATQHLQPDHGDEKTALDSIHALFGLTRNTLKNEGRHCNEFRHELTLLQQELRKYTKMLADMAGVEDLTALETVD